MKPRIRFAPGILAAGLIALLTASPVWAQMNSHARIVRLSFVEGEVSVERPDVQNWAEAPVNTPIQEGFKLSTAENSFAEIQFENGGAIRLGQFSLLDFTELQLAPDGGKINRVELRQGYATFHPLASSLRESLQVTTPYAVLTAEGGTRFRVDLDQDSERVEVFEGTVDVQSNLGAMTLGEDSVLVMQPGSPEPTVVSQGITEDEWDQWVGNREAQLANAPSGPSPDDYSGGASEAVYGWSDLLQYGTWSDVPGWGYGWTPTVVAGGWTPYSFGQWCWYPGWGYTWIGAEPWGWLPYHYGGWEFIPGRGWVWFPGSLRTWSPGLVIWFNGPNWVGWIPRPHRKGGDTGCGRHCGGGVVSASTFLGGGRLAPNQMLGLDPTRGERVAEPGFAPTLATRLPGRAVPIPVMQGPGHRGKPARAPDVVSAPAAARPPRGIRHPVEAPPNSTIVYDPQQNTYINDHRVMAPQQPQVSPGEANAPAGNPRWVQTAPGRHRQPEERPAGNTGSLQPNPPAGWNPPKPTGTGSRTVSEPRGNRNESPSGISPANSSPRQGASGTHASPSGVRPAGGGQQGSSGTHAVPSGGRPASGGQPSGGRGGGGSGAPAGGRFSSPPSGGEHAAPPKH